MMRDIRECAQIARMPDTVVPLSQFAAIDDLLASPHWHDLAQPILRKPALSYWIIGHVLNRQDFCLVQVLAKEGAPRGERP